MVSCAPFAYHALQTNKMHSIDRRLFLKFLAAAAVTNVGALRATAQGRKHIVVVGAGIIGASISYYLSRAGAQVTLIDREGPATHASKGTFAWINATWAKQPQSYHHFNQESVLGWHQWAKDLQMPVKWGGSLEWFETAERMAQLKTQIAEQVAWGEPAKMLDRSALEALEPNVIFGNEVVAAYSPNDGAVDPVKATEILIHAAQNMGATVQYPANLIGMKPLSNGKAVAQTSIGDIEADQVILATGANEDIVQQVTGHAVPQRSTPGVIVETAPMPPLLNRIVVAPGVHIHQRLDGSVILGEQDGAPDTVMHRAWLKSRPNRYPSKVLAEQHAKRILTVARQFVPGLKAAKVADVSIGWRPLPLDGHPVIGSFPEMPQVYLAFMHSGVSLSPLVGALVAEEVLGNKRLRQLSDYRPDHTFKNIKRY